MAVLTCPHEKAGKTQLKHGGHLSSNSEDGQPENASMSHWMANHAWVVPKASIIGQTERGTMNCKGQTYQEG